MKALGHLANGGFVHRRVRLFGDTIRLAMAQFAKQTTIWSII